MGYIYATPLQKEKLIELQNKVVQETDFLRKFDQYQILEADVIAQIMLATYKDANVVMGSSAWSNVPVNNEFIKKFRLFTPVYITQKFLVSYAKPPGNVDSSDNLNYRNIRDANPYGGNGFLVEWATAKSEAGKKAKQNIELAKRELSDYEKILSDQDKKRDLSVSNIGLSDTINSVNKAIEAATSDPKKLAIYIAIGLIIIIILFALIKKISQ